MCFSPPANESSLIFPARSPPKSASSSAVCRNTRFAISVVKTGFMSAPPGPDISCELMGWNSIVDTTIMMNRNMTTEK